MYLNRWPLWYQPHLHSQMELLIVREYQTWMISPNHPDHGPLKPGMEIRSRSSLVIKYKFSKSAFFSFQVQLRSRSPQVTKFILSLHAFMYFFHDWTPNHSMTIIPYYSGKFSLVIMKGSCFIIPWLVLIGEHAVRRSVHLLQLFWPS